VAYKNSFKSKFTNASGSYLTQGLFDSFCNDSAIYTLRDADTDLPSLRKLYLEAEDPVEFDFAEKYLGSWKHWNMLCKAPFFKPHIEEWRTALEQKLRSRALRNLMDEASDPQNRGFVQANKLLLDKGYLEDDKPKRGRGRPKKEETKEDVDLTRIRQDAARILNIKDLN